MSPLRWHKDSIRAGPSEVGGSVLSLSPSSARGQCRHPGACRLALPPWCILRTRDCLDGRLSECRRVVDTVACVTDGREGPVLVDRDYLPPLLNNSNGIFCTQSFVPWSVFWRRKWLKVVKWSPELLGNQWLFRWQCWSLSSVNTSYVFRNLNLTKQI